MKKKLFLNSSFFFPFIGVDVEDCNKNDILSLINNNKYEIYRSNFTIFELSAKGGKLVLNSEIELKYLIDGINTVQNLLQINVIPLYYSEIQILSLQFRKTHSDFIDCLLLSSAIYYSDILVTLDKNLKKKFRYFPMPELAPVTKIGPFTLLGLILSMSNIRLISYSLFIII